VAPVADRHQLKEKFLEYVGIASVMNLCRPRLTAPFADTAGSLQHLSGNPSPLRGPQIRVVFDPPLRTVGLLLSHMLLDELLTLLSPFRSVICEQYLVLRWAAIQYEGFADRLLD
jgi:hypothetical protein